MSRSMEEPPLTECSRPDQRAGRACLHDTILRRSLQGESPFHSAPRWSSVGGRTGVFSLEKYKMEGKKFYMQYILDFLCSILYTLRWKRREAMRNKKLKIARVACDMSQEDLARAVGVTRQTIGLIEAGNYNPTLKLCVAICKALDQTLNDLFWEEP